MFAAHFQRRTAEEMRARRVHARDVAFHVARVDHVGGLLDELAVMAFDAMTFNEPRDLHQQFFVAKRKIEIVVRAGVKTFESRVTGFSNAADQEHGDVSGAWIVLQTATEFETTDNGHYDVAHHDVGSNAWANSSASTPS